MSESTKARNALWKLGILDFLWHTGQEELHRQINEMKTQIKVILCSRQFGKSTYLVSRALATCQEQPYAIVKYACPKQSEVKKVIRPLMRELQESCPPHLRAEWKEADKMFLFPNGSELHVAGTDSGHADSLRGVKADLCIVDEAGFCSDLHYVVYSVLIPMLTHTSGDMILASTPSKNMDHEFMTDFVFPAMGDGTLQKLTLYDNPLLSESDIQRIINLHPMKEKDQNFKREYLCEILSDTSSMVIPEFTQEMSERCVVEVKRPPYYDIYVSCDVGWRDLTVVLFGYYDFIKSQLVILDEIVMNEEELTTGALSFAIKKKEAELFLDPISQEPREPYARWMDNTNLLLISDLMREHDILFQPTAKDGKSEAVNKLRMMVGAGRVIIHPRCKTLKYHMNNASWDKAGKIFKHIRDTTSGDVKGGHADAVDALIYMARNVVYSRNPYPPGYDTLTGDGVWDSLLVKSDESKTNKMWDRVNGRGFLTR